MASDDVMEFLRVSECSFHKGCFTGLPLDLAESIRKRASLTAWQRTNISFIAPVYLCAIVKVLKMISVTGHVLSTHGFARTLSHENS